MDVGEPWPHRFAFRAAKAFCRTWIDTFITIAIPSMSGLWLFFRSRPLQQELVAAALGELAGPN
jgi:hypothetical protein